MKFIRLALALPLALLLLAACNEQQASTENPSTAPDAGQAFDLGDIGMRGMEWRGEATLLGGLHFPEAELDLSTIAFQLRTEPRDMSEFDSPALEFRGEPVSMALHVSGLIEDREPGRFSVAIESVRPAFSGGPGTAGTEALLADLAANGIALPAADSSNPILVTFEARAADEDRREITLRSDADWIESVEMRDGERAGF